MSGPFKEMRALMKFLFHTKNRSCQRAWQVARKETRKIQKKMKIQKDQLQQEAISN